MPIPVVVVLSVLGAVLSLMLLAGLISLLRICPPNEVLIFSGRRHRLADGASRGFRLIFGGRGWRVPLIESVDRMKLNVMEIPISIRNAYSKGGVPMNVDAIGNVKISSDPNRVSNAIERFLGRGNEEIGRVARETLEGHLRGVLATLTPEEVNEDRLKFADSLTHESEEDFRKLGLQLDTLKIQNVTDEQNYLNSIGRGAIANVIRAAEIAESDAKREAEEAEAAETARANVTKAQAEAEIAQMNNELRRIKAELEAQVKSEEERTRAAAREARAVAEQQLQQVRTELEEIRLQADEVLPAEADRQRREYEARGDAASIREKGQAVSVALDQLHAAWASAGDDAMSIYLIEEIEKILGQVTKGVSKVQVKNLRMIDGGSGEVLSGYVQAYPQMVGALFDAIAATTGIDIPKTLAGTGGSAGAGDAVSDRPRSETPRKGA